MSKKTIGLDIDGVVTINSNLFNCIKKEFGNFSSKDFIHYNLSDSLLHLGKIKSKNEFCDKTFFQKYADDIYLNARPRAGLKDFLTYLYHLNYDVHFVTARPENCEQITYDFFHKNSLPVRPGNVHFVGSYDKGSVLNSLDINTFFEDRGETLIHLLNSGIIEKGYLVDAPYNKSFNHSNLKRINNFNDLNFKRIK